MTALRDSFIRDEVTGTRAGVDTLKRLKVDSLSASIAALIHEDVYSLIHSVTIGTGTSNIVFGTDDDKLLFSFDILTTEASTLTFAEQIAGFTTGDPQAPFNNNRNSEDLLGFDVHKNATGVSGGSDIISDYQLGVEGNPQNSQGGEASSSTYVLKPQTSYVLTIDGSGSSASNILKWALTFTKITDF